MVCPQALCCGVQRFDSLNSAHKSAVFLLEYGRVLGVFSLRISTMTRILLRPVWMLSLTLTVAGTSAVASAPIKECHSETTIAPVAAEAAVSLMTMPDLRDQPAGQERKEAFISLLMPIIKDQNARIFRDRQWLLAARSATGWTDQAAARFDALCARYGVPCSSKARDQIQWDFLLSRVDVIPSQMVMVQAIEESGWGTSRFARESNNLFGMRCFARNCGVAQQGIDPDEAQRFQQFASINDNVNAYLLNINTHAAYEGLRQQRAQLRRRGRPVQANTLIASLERYSERGPLYLAQLRSLLSTNGALIQGSEFDERIVADNVTVPNA